MDIFDTTQFKELEALPHGGGFGVIKFGDFRRTFAFKSGDQTGEMDEEKIKLMFIDLGQQMAIAWKHRHD